MLSWSSIHHCSASLSHRCSAYSLPSSFFLVEAPKYSCSAETFASLIPVETVGEGRWPALEVIARLVDGSRFHPFKEKYGPTLLTGFARINGSVFVL